MAAITTVEVGQNFTSVEITPAQNIIEITPVSGASVEISGVTIVKESAAQLNFPTAKPLGANRVIAMTPDGVDYASLDIQNEIVGFSKFAAEANSTLIVAESGLLGGFSGLQIGEPIFLASNGTITQTPSTTGILQQLGVATSDTQIYIQIQPSIFLGN